MSDSNEFTFHITERGISHEQIIRCDRDIQTLVHMRDYLTQQNMNYAIADGYAVEAHCGGEITRSHGDMDVYVFVPQSFDPVPLRQSLGEVLRHEITNWKVHEVGEDGHAIEFREDDDSKTFEGRRRLEVAFLGPEITPRTQTRTLIDSKGDRYEFAIEHIADLAAAKIIKLVDLSQLSLEEREERGLRSTRPSDFHEIKRLLGSLDLDEIACREALRMYFTRGNNTVSHEEALKQANTYWEQLSLLLQNN